MTVPETRPVILYLVLWSAALLLAGLVLSSLPLSSIIKTVSGLGFSQWFLWGVLNILIIFLYVSRWSMLNRALGINIPFRVLLMVRQAGQAVSFITPGPQFGGEPLQIYWFWKRLNCSANGAILAVGLDRFYELWINFAVLLSGTLFLLSSPMLVQVNFLEISLFLVFCLLVLTFSAWLLLHQRNTVSYWIKGMSSRWSASRRLASLDSRWDEMVQQLQMAVETGKAQLFKAFSLTILGWAGMILEIYLLLFYLGIPPGFYELVFIMVAMRLAFLLPLPGGIGSVEVAMFWVFTALGLPAIAVVAIIALMRLRDAVILVFGLWALYCLQRRRQPATVPGRNSHGS